METLKEIRTTIKNWWVLLVLGLLFIGSGIIVFMNPLESYVTLAMLFAIGILVAGFIQSWFAISNRKEIDGWGWQLALGIMEIFIGFVLISNVDFTLTILPFYVGFWLLFRSFALIGFSFELKSFKVLNWGYYLIFGFALALFSWFVILHPVFGGFTLVTWTGIALIVAGVAHLVLSFKLKKINKKIVKVENAAG